jgi:hypothetical protein
MLSRIRRTLALVAFAGVFAIGVVGTNPPKPAEADFSYTQWSPLFGILGAPDICAFGGCILLGSFGSELNSVSQLYNQIQQAKMEVQNLKSGPLGALGGMGVGDPVSGNLLQTIMTQVGNASRQNQALTCSNALQSSAPNNRTDLLSLFGVQRGSGVGNLASNQISAVVMQKLAGELEEQNQCKAAEVQAQQANVEKAYYNMADEFDLNSAPTAGFLLY